MNQPPYGPPGDQPGGYDPRAWGPPPQPGHGSGPYGPPGPTGPFGPPGPPPGPYGPLGPQGPPGFGQYPYSQQPFGPPGYGPPGYGPPGQGWPPPGPGGPKNRGPLIAASIAAVLIVVAAVVATVVLLSGDDSDSSAGGASPGTSAPRNSSSNGTGSSSDDDEIASAIQTYATAFTDGDGDGLAQVVCSTDLQTMQRSMTGARGGASIDTPEVVVTDIVVTGDTATAKFAFASVGVKVDVTLIKEGGGWKLCPSGG